MNFLDRVEQWLLDQDPDESSDLIDHGDGVTMTDVHLILETGGKLVEVYDYHNGDYVIRFTFSDGTDYYMEGAINDVNNELW